MLLLSPIVSSINSFEILTDYGVGVETDSGEDHGRRHFGRDVESFDERFVERLVFFEERLPLSDVSNISSLASGNGRAGGRVQHTLLGIGHRIEQRNCVIPESHG